MTSESDSAIDSERVGRIDDADGLSQYELIDRFPELELIEDKDVYFDTARAIIENEMKSFWEAPAASSYKHHNLYAVTTHGLWIHTKMVFTAYQRMVDSYVEQDLITEYEADLGRSACLLHDFRKHGEAGYPENEKATKDHDLVMATLIREETDLDERVADAIASHMGPWYEGPAPETPLQQLVHMADMAASTKNGTFGVYKPHDKIRELYLSIPEADL